MMSRAAVLLALVRIVLASAFYLFRSTNSMNTIRYASS